MNGVRLTNMVFSFRAVAAAQARSAQKNRMCSNGWPVCAALYTQARPKVHWRLAALDPGTADKENPKTSARKQGTMVGK